MPHRTTNLPDGHIAILLTNRIDKRVLLSHIFESGEINEPVDNSEGRGLLFSDQAIQDIIQEEERYDKILVAKSSDRKLKTFSAGERKKLLIEHCLAQKPGFLVIDNPFDHLDTGSRQLLKDRLETLSSEIKMVQLENRREDIFDFIDKRFYIDSLSEGLVPLAEMDEVQEPAKPFNLPHIVQEGKSQTGAMVRLESVRIAFGEKKVLRDISWTIMPNEFWQLTGPNGSGKSSLLALITGDSTKGYGQEVYLFGKKKGSGESVWDIKKKIGYFSTAMLDLFRMGHTVGEMVLSGFYDSIGLYDIPSAVQKSEVRFWLGTVGLEEKSRTFFHKLSEGEQRVVLILRAVIKDPALILLDEPLEGLDDKNTLWMVRLINLLVERTAAAVVLVSHIKAPGLLPCREYALVPGEDGATGTAKDYVY